MECTAARVAPEDYNDAIEALNLAMPPCAVFKVVPDRFFVPRIVVIGGVLVGAKWAPQGGAGSPYCRL
jgi:hypothetical protein